MRNKMAFGNQLSLSVIPLLLALFISRIAGAQIQVVDMIPSAMSDETRINGEPYVTVNPANSQLIAATAFMATPAGSPNGPLFVSTDGGATWVARNIIPSSPGSFFNTGDITIRFNSAGTALYGGILRAGTFGFLDVIGTTDMTLTTPMTVLNAPRPTDQPYIYSLTVIGSADAGKDRVWVGNNEGFASPASATVDQSLDAGIATPAFTQIRIDADTPVARDNYQVRTVAHADGHAYAAFYRRMGALSDGYNADVVVVRDNDWGKSTPPFQSLVDSVTLVAGQNVIAGTPVSDTFGSSATLGNEWWGGDLYLTVDPRNSAHVYISYSDSQAGAQRTLHLRRSTDFGQTWAADILTTPSAKNAAIAINSEGTIGYLFQKLTGTAPTQRWQTHLRRSANGTVWDDVVLADFPAEGPAAPVGSRIVGDYLNMVAVGKNFYGVFSSYNDLVNANFPSGVTFLRNKTSEGDPMPRFLGIDGFTTVAPSIDPFFFSVKAAEPQIQVPGNIEFSNTCGGTTSMSTLNVCNTGKIDLIVGSIISSNPSFSVTTPTSGNPVTISPDFCFPYQVLFTSATTGSQTANLTIPSNDSKTPNTIVTVTGIGTEPDVRITGSPDFRVVSAWRTGEKTLSVCNTGGCDLSVTSASLGCTDFSLIQNPFPAAVSHDSCLDLVVRFTPAQPGFKVCNLTVATNDPDSPMVSRNLTARTPPSFSLHAGLVTPHGALHNTAKQGSTFNLDFVDPFRPRWAWDVRFGWSRFDGKSGQPDTTLQNLSADIKFTVNPASAVHIFLNAGFGLYHFNPGIFKAGGNLGLGLNIPLNRRFALEGTYNFHSTFFGSPPNMRFSQIQMGLMISF